MVLSHDNKVDVDQSRGSAVTDNKLEPQLAISKSYFWSDRQLIVHTGHAEM